MYKGSLFFNYQALKDVLLIVIDNSKIADEVKRVNDVVGLYYKGKLIGVNIFNSSTYLKLRVVGLVHNPNAPLAKLIYDIIKANLDEEVMISSSLTYLARVLTRIDKLTYMISLGESSFKANSLEEVKEGDYILVAERDTTLDNGNISSSYMDKDSCYLIVAQEIDASENELGTQTYYLKEN